MKNPEKKNSPILFNLLFNIVIPAVVLSKFSGDAYLGPLYALVVALSFPVTFGLYELIIEKRKNFISLLGFVSTLLTGVIGIMEFPQEWIAIKEAAIPFIIGLVVLISTWTPFPLVKKMVYNKEMLNVEKIDNILQGINKTSAFERILAKSSVLLASSFFLSSFLNYVLAKVLIQSKPGTTAFTEELGKMTWLSYPVIVLPSLVIIMGIFWYLFSSIKKLTNLTSSEIFAAGLQDVKKETS